MLNFVATKIQVFIGAGELCEIERELLFAERSTREIGTRELAGHVGSNLRFLVDLLTSDVVDACAVKSCQQWEIEYRLCGIYFLTLSMKSSLIPEAGKR